MGYVRTSIFVLFLCVYKSYLHFGLYKQTLGAKVNEDFGDTVPSKPPQVPNGAPVVGVTVKVGGQEEAGEGIYAV